MSVFFSSFLGSFGVVFGGLLALWAAAEVIKRIGGRK